MSWLKKLFGGGSDDPPRNEPAPPPIPPSAPEEPGEKQPDDAELDRMVEAGFNARTEFFSRLGEVDEDVLAPLINPAFMGGPRWPAMRQAWRIIRRSNSTLLASDGLSDPFDDDLTPLGFQLEVAVETGEQFADVTAARDSWVFQLVYQAAQAVAGAGGIRGAIENGLVVTTVFRLPDVPERLRDTEDRVGVIIGFPSRELPRAMELPGGDVLLLMVKPLLPSELTWIEAAEDGQAARRELIERLQQQPNAHFATADRDAVA